MLNYKWELIRENYAVLRNEDFSDISFKVPFMDIDVTLQSYLEGCGIRMNLSMSGDYYLSRTNEDRTTITAPLYRKCSSGGKYILIEEQHTAETIDPYEYFRVKEIYEECKKAEKKKHKEQFESIFNQETIDGKCASVVVTKNPLSSDKAFYEKDVPEGYIKMCERKIANNYWDMLFIKKFDAKGQPIDIKTRFSSKGLIVGKGGKNIKRVAKLINASNINVI